MNDIGTGLFETNAYSPHLAEKHLDLQLTLFYRNGQYHNPWLKRSDILCECIRIHQATTSLQFQLPTLSN